MGYYTRSCKMSNSMERLAFSVRIQDQVTAKHPPEYYIDGLQTYIRGANLVEKASTLVSK